jgi:uncharacterized membrane protein
MSTPNHSTTKWSEIILLAFVYALFLPLVTAPIGFIISAIKVYRFKRLAERSNEALDQDVILIATHHEWLVRTLIFMIILAMASIGLAYYIVGVILSGVVVIWWIYRVIRGMTALVAYKSMPATICTQAICYGQTESVKAA